MYMYVQYDIILCILMQRSYGGCILTLNNVFKNWPLRMYAHTHTHARTHARTHTHAHTHTHTHTHKQTHTHVIIRHTKNLLLPRKLSRPHWSQDNPSARWPNTEPWHITCYNTSPLTTTSTTAPLGLEDNLPPSESRGVDLRPFSKIRSAD